MALPDRAWLAAGRDAMTHRGPDDAGEWWSDDGRVGLAHRRLSIIDLSAAGHQPMSDADGALHIVFNGEIYNFADLGDELAAKGYTFRSHSDTEVILAAYREWDTECLARLSGMFAFALYDARQQAVFLARDRAGEKPLFYHCDRGTLRFASELKGLLADPKLQRRIDPVALDCYLAMGYGLAIAASCMDSGNCRRRTLCALNCKPVKRDSGAIGNCRNLRPLRPKHRRMTPSFSMNWSRCLRIPFAANWSRTFPWGCS